MRDVARSAVVIVVAALALPLPAEEPPRWQLPDSVTCSTAWVAMRDGVLLATQVVQPKSPGRYPVLIMCTPYARTHGNDCLNKPGSIEQMASFASRGYVAISQESRGTGRSHGVLNPFFQEQNDGFDTVEWAAAQPWSNGKVGMVGSSYVGATQWQAALAGPSHLIAITPGVTAADYHDDWTYNNGVFGLSFNLVWAVRWFGPDMLIRRLRSQGMPQSQIDIRETEFREALNRSESEKGQTWAWELPLAGDWDPELKKDIPFYFQWLEHPFYDAYWRKIDVSANASKIKVPALISGSWYDLFAEGSVQSYHSMINDAATAKARSETMLVMSCCGHSPRTRVSPTQITWGDDPIDVTLADRFLDYQMMGIDNGISREPRVQLTVLVPPDAGYDGTSFLVETDRFPMKDTQWRKWYLRSHGKANSRRGDGVLAHSPQVPGDEPDHFTYDPRNPVLTVGGNSGRSTKHPPGAFDQSEVELRDDILVYTSEPLGEDLAVIGPVSVRFWARSSERDTDFTAKLVDVHPDEVAHNVVDRIVRASLRKGSRSKPEPIEPGVSYEYQLTLGHTATFFRKSHRVRLEISSSNFPHYARNLNTGKSNERTADIVIARQTILHDSSHPSYVLLPVVSNVGLPQKLK